MTITESTGDGNRQGDVLEHSLQALVNPASVGLEPDASPREIVVHVHPVWADDHAAWALICKLLVYAEDVREQASRTGGRTAVLASYGYFNALQLYNEIRLAALGRS